jgi:predicted MPP superfamily phosphohydrolase
VTRYNRIMLSRRTFLQIAGSSVAAATGLGVYTSLVEPRWVEIVHRPLPIHRLPAKLAGKTLVHFSDIHVGYVSLGYVLDTFARVAALNPDIVVITGDLIGLIGGVFEMVPNVYDRLPKGRYATVATLGNHDYGSFWRDEPIAERVIESVTPLGITVLRNQVYDCEGLQIVGLDDLWARQFKPARALAALDSARASIALSHNPDTVDLPVWDRYEGWILAGHTHGGQCKPPFLPPPVLPVKNRRYTAGEFALSGRRRLYISRGLGHALSVRFNVRPEVTIFELRAT